MLNGSEVLKLEPTKTIGYIITTHSAQKTSYPLGIGIEEQLGNYKTHTHTSSCLGRWKRKVLTALYNQI